MTEAPASSIEVVPIEKNLVVGFNVKIVGLRWDLVPWGLVVDLDVPRDSDLAQEVGRAWLAFASLRDLTFPAEAARVPHGCFGADEVWTTSKEDGTRVFEFQVLLPVFDAADVMKPHPSRLVTVSAQSGFLIRSSGSAIPDSDAGLSFRQRQSLASDESLLAVLERSVT